MHCGCEPRHVPVNGDPVHKARLEGVDHGDDVGRVPTVGPVRQENVGWPLGCATVEPVRFLARPKVGLLSCLVEENAPFFDVVVLETRRGRPR